MLKFAGFVCTQYGGLQHLDPFEAALEYEKASGIKFQKI